MEGTEGDLRVIRLRAPCILQTSQNNHFLYLYFRLTINVCSIAAMQLIKLTQPGVAILPLWMQLNFKYHII